MYVILALLLLGVLIIAHEAGHFWAARACGISVQEFSMGMGPLLPNGRAERARSFPFACCLSAAIASFTARTRIAPTRARLTTRRFGSARSRLSAGR